MEGIEGKKYICKFCGKESKKSRDALNKFGWIHVSNSDFDECRKKWISQGSNRRVEDYFYIDYGMETAVEEAKEDVTNLKCLDRQIVIWKK